MADTFPKLRLFALGGALLIHLALVLFLLGPGRSLASSFTIDETPLAKSEKKPLDLIFVEAPTSDEEKPDPDTPFYSNIQSRAQSDEKSEQKEFLKSLDGQQDEILRLEDTQPTQSIFQPPAKQNPQSNNEPDSNEMTHESKPVENIEESIPSSPIEIKSPELPTVTPEIPSNSTEDNSQTEAIKPIPAIKTDPEDDFKPLSAQPPISPTSKSNPQKPSPNPSIRPKSLSEARKKLNLVGQRSKIISKPFHSPGATGMVDSLNRSFGDYDLKMQIAIQNLWHKYVNSLVAGNIEKGKVVLKFRLHQNGSIETTKVHSSSVGLLLTGACQDAVENAAPYGKWNEKMKEEIGLPHRDITFTFSYR